MINDQLNELYSNPKYGLVGRDRFWPRVKEHLPHVTYRQMAEFLRSHPINQRHQRQKKAPVVRPIISKRVHERWQADLIEVPRQHFNKNYRYILTIIDHHSKYAWAYPSKDKQGRSIAALLSPLLMKHRPSILQTDNGSEFVNEHVQRLLERSGTKHLVSLPYKPRTNGAVERFNLTLKTMLSRYQVQNGTKVWINALPVVLKNYNSAIHSTTGASPEDVFKGARSGTPGIRRQAAAMVERAERIPIGSIVRIARTSRGLAKKGYDYWSKETYTVRTASRHKQPRYTLDGKPGIFYTHELQVVPNVIPVIEHRAPEIYPDRERILREVQQRPYEKRSSRTRRAPSRLNL